MYNKSYLYHGDRIIGGFNRPFGFGRPLGFGFPFFLGAATGAAFRPYYYPPYPYYY